MPRLLLVVGLIYFGVMMVKGFARYHTDSPGEKTQYKVYGMLVNDPNELPPTQRAIAIRPLYATRSVVAGPKTCKMLRTAFYPSLHCPELGLSCIT